MTRDARAFLHTGLHDLDLLDYEPTLWDYFQLLKHWNQTYNLVANADDEILLTRHLFDSLAVGPHIKPGRCLDVGTGPGLPGLLLAVTMPDTEWVVLDANGKKIRFCEQAIHELGLENARAVQHRIESYQPDYLFDTIISRAYAQAGDFIQQTERLLDTGGRILAMKGRIDEEEKDKAAKAGFRMEIEALSVPRLTGQRHVMIFTK